MFKPIESEDGFFYEMIGKHFTQNRKDANFDPKNIEFWDGLHVYFNAEEDEQVIAIEKSSKLGFNPMAVLKSFINNINTEWLDCSPYRIEIFELKTPNSFYESVANIDTVITDITFDYVVPNPFGSEGQTKKMLTNLKNEVSAVKVKMGLNNPDGLDFNSKEVRNGVEYTERGGGKMSAKSGKESIYKSTDHKRVAHITFEEQEQIINGSSLKQILKKILKR